MSRLGESPPSPPRPTCTRVPLGSRAADPAPPAPPSHRRLSHHRWRLPHGDRAVRVLRQAGMGRLSRPFPPWVGPGAPARAAVWPTAVVSR
jgi:hypothetical protein